LRQICCSLSNTNFSYLSIYFRLQWSWCVFTLRDKYERKTFYLPIYLEMNIEKTKVMRISRQPSPVTIMIDQKQLENVECYKYLGSMLTDDGRCTRGIKSRIAMAKAAFSKKKNLFTRKLELNLKKKLIKCYIWSMALYGAETWIFRQQIKNTWKVLKCGAGEGWRRSVGPIT